MVAAPALVADIGGTNARFALIHPGSDDATDIEVLRCADYPGPDAAAQAYLDKVAPPVRPNRGAFDVACPVTGDIVQLTNHPWRFSIEAVRRHLGLDKLDVVNDFTAVALCVPRLKPTDWVQVGPGAPEEGWPVAVIGPGTGLGVASLAPSPSGWIPLAAEGGHTTMAAATDWEDEVLRWLRHRFEHVSAERVVSGPGLVNLYDAVTALRGKRTSPLSSAEITERALSGEHAFSREALDMFYSMLGTVAGNLALSVGARGGVYLAGGILPRMIEDFTASGFRSRFEDKGRFRAYLANVPTRVITHPFPAFVGLAGLVAEG